MTPTTGSVYVILEESVDGYSYTATWIDGKESADDAVDHFLEGPSPGTKYRPYKLMVAKLEDFREYTVKPSFDVEKSAWDPWRDGK